MLGSDPRGFRMISRVSSLLLLLLSSWQCRVGLLETEMSRPNACHAVIGLLRSVNTWSQCVSQLLQHSTNWLALTQPLLPQ